MKKLLTAVIINIAICLIGVFSCTNGKSTSEEYWWQPLANKLNVSFNDIMVYGGSIEFEHIFINGELEYMKDSISVFKNGIAFGKYKDQYKEVNDRYQVFYFSEFNIGPVDFEIVFDKYAFYTVDGLQLIEEKEEPGFYYKLWTDKAEGITHMCSYSYFEGIEKDTTEMNK